MEGCCGHARRAQTAAQAARNFKVVLSIDFSPAIALIEEIAALLISFGITGKHGLSSGDELDWHGQFKTAGLTRPRTS